MKTLELLSLDEASLTAALKIMKLKELERHAEKIVQKTGSNNYSELLGLLIKRIPLLDKNKNRFQEVQKFLLDQKPFKDYQKEDKPRLVERLSILMMLIIKYKFNEIHEKKSLH